MRVSNCDDKYNFQEGKVSGFEVLTWIFLGFLDLFLFFRVFRVLKLTGMSASEICCRKMGWLMICRPTIDTYKQWSSVAIQGFLSS